MSVSIYMCNLLSLVFFFSNLRFHSLEQRSILTERERERERERGRGRERDVCVC